MKRILFLISDFQKIGGISRFNKEFLSALIEKKLEVILISMNDREKKYGDIPVLSFGGIFNKFFRKAAFSWAVFQKTLSLSPCLIICGHINFSPLCFILKVLFNKDYALLVHGVEAYQNMNGLKVVSVKTAKVIIAVSEYTKRKLMESTGALEEKIFILSPPIDSTKFTKKEKPERLIQKHRLGNSKIILTVARMSQAEKYKGYDKVLEALPAVFGIIPDAKYLLVGDGNDCPRIEALVSSLGLTEKVILCGRVPDQELVDYYNVCDVFIMPSQKEGFGIVFLEALACGKPVIAGNSDGSKDALLNGELGTLVDPNRKEDIQRALVDLLTAHVKRELLNGDLLRKRVIEEYGISRFRVRLKEILSQIDVLH